MSIKKVVLSWLSISMLVILSCSFLVPASVQAKEKVIRVGWPAQQGLSMKDENGQYYGYTYDYLKEIAQYTNWEYEFIEVEGDINEQLNTLLDMLHKGEIDLLGGMRYNATLAEIYDYPGESYGSAYNTLAVRTDNEEIDEFNLTKIKNLKVALIEGASARNEKFDQFAQISGFTYERIMCETQQEAQEKIMNNEADAMIFVDVGMEEGFRSVAKFSSDPYYFATTKGNSAIIYDLNRALLNIYDTNPTLERNLYAKYFEPAQKQLILTQEEKAYIQEKEMLRVLVMDGLGPITYENGGLSRGFAIAVLDRIAELSGLQISYVEAQTIEDYHKAIDEGNIDLILCVPYNYNVAQELNVSLSLPYLETPISLAIADGVNPSNLSNLKRAVSADFRFEEGVNDSLIYDTVEDALQAIERGEADYFYGIGLTISFYSNQHNFQNLKQISSLSDETGRFSFGISKDEDTRLSSIINKSLRCIPETDKERYLYENVYVESEYSISLFISKHPLETFLVIAFLAGIAIFYFYRHYHREMKMKNRIEIENKRYKMLTEITGESIFEYDFEKDILRVSGNGIGILKSQGELLHYRAEIENSLTKGIKKENTLLTVIDEIDEETHEVLLREKNGVLRWYRVHTRVAYDQSHRPVTMIGRAMDIHEEKMEKEELVKNAQIDKLTDIFNADSTRELIEKACQNAELGSCALLIGDLDHFKDINDRFGHYRGDKVLSETAALMKKIFSGRGIIGRLGGDEFLIFVEHVHHEDEVIALCNHLISSLKEMEIAMQLEQEITMSIGYTILSHPGHFEDFYKEADEALYEVKKNGRNGIMCYGSIPKDSQ